METQNPRISLITAIARTSRTIGKEGGGIPWHIKEDFAHFKNTTMGHPIIMGRKTWEEFKGKPLPGRTHIVVTTQNAYTVPEGHFVCSNINDAIKKASEINNEEIFIIGGAQLYAAALPYASRLYLTLVDIDIDGPAKFPDYQRAGFQKIIEQRQSKDEHYSYEFQIIEK